MRYLTEKHEKLARELEKMPREMLEKLVDLLPVSTIWLNWDESHKPILRRGRYSTAKRVEMIRNGKLDVLCSYLSAAAEYAISKQLQMMLDLRVKELEILKSSNELLKTIKDCKPLMEAATRGLKAVMEEYQGVVPGGLNVPEE